MMCDLNTSRLNKLATPAVWKTGSEGIRSHITQQMKSLQTSIEDEISYAFADKDHCKGHVIASMCLTASVAFVTQLLNFIDSLNHKLHLPSKFAEKAAWSLTMQILDGICANLYVPKDGVDNVMKGDRTSICSYIMWASFKTHDISKEYLEVKFENHPALSSEFIKFLATNR
jgi:hypothetical protein